MPSTAVYFAVLPSKIALIAACLMLSGVSKSGSPAPSPITSRPAAFKARALSVTAMVAEGLMRDSESLSRAIPESPSSAGLRAPQGRPFLEGHDRRGKTQIGDDTIKAVDDCHGGFSVPAGLDRMRHSAMIEVTKSKRRAGLWNWGCLVRSRSSPGRAAALGRALPCHSPTKAAT